MISRKDRRIMEAFEEKYTPEELLNTIQDIKKNTPVTKSHIDVTDESDEISIPEAILLYIKKLEGYRIRFKEIHWSTKNKAEHELTDSLTEKLLEYEDEIAENAMGIFAVRIKAGDIVPEFPAANSSLDKNSIVTALIDLLLYDTYTLQASLEPEDVRPEVHIKSILDILDDLVRILIKSKYLATMS